MLQQRIAQVLQKHTAVICSRVRANWGRSSAIKGLAEINSDFPRIIGTTIVATLNAHGLAAWINEYGSGSAMDTKSPYYAQYIASPMFNKERLSEGNEFIAREQGATVYRPDGSQYTSSGKAHRRIHKMNTASYRSDGLKGQYGLHLERPLNFSGKYPGFKAFLGQHVIKREIDLEYPTIVLEVNKVIIEYTQEQLRQL